MKPFLECFSKIALTASCAEWRTLALSFMHKVNSTENALLTTPDSHSSFVSSWERKISPRQLARERMAEGSISLSCDLYVFVRIPRQSLHFSRFTLSDTEGSTS